MATSLSLDYNKFADVLDNQSKMDVKNHSSHHGWFNKEDGTFGQALEYSYDGDANYRDWYMETSQPPQQMGLLVSLKIDHIRGGGQDDHIILICGFDVTGQLSLAQVTIQITSDASKNLVVAPVTQADATAAHKNIEDVVYDRIHAHDFKDDGRNTMAQVVRANILSLRQSVG